MHSQVVTARWKGPADYLDAFGDQLMDLIQHI